jgi:hypothetical protein
VAGEDEVTDEVPETPGWNAEEEAGEIEGFAVGTAERVHALADDAVADSLDRKQQWRSSPVLPASWPSKGTDVRVYLYPMAVHPDSTSRYELFSAEWVVHVSLEDGTTRVDKLGKRRRLGTLEQKRPSMLERNELAIAEQTLVEHVAGRDAPVGENNYWGYLKFFREHPHLARDIARRAPAFVQWLNRGRR